MSSLLGVRPVFHTINDDFVYYALTFFTKRLEGEHGLAIDMHKSRCVEHGTGEGTNNKNIVAELNLPKDLAQRINEQMDNEKPIIHKPHPKYNKLKPWQIDANRRFSVNAYRELNDSALIEAFNREKLDLKNYKYIYQYAKRDNREVLINYFEN